MAIESSWIFLYFEPSTFGFELVILLLTAGALNPSYPFCSFTTAVIQNLASLREPLMPGEHKCTELLHSPLGAASCENGVLASTLTSSLHPT